MPEREAMNCSFILKPSVIHGVGVFAVRDFTAGEHLPLFSEDYVVLGKWPDSPFDAYCFEGSRGIVAPPDFTCMSVGWYLNSSSNPNARRDASYEWFALRNIKSGEEITIDYDQLREKP